MTTMPNDRVRNARTEKGRRMKLLRGGALTALAILMTGAGHVAMTGCSGSDAEPLAASGEGENENENEMDGGQEPTEPDADTGAPVPAPPVSPPPPVEGKATVGVFVSGQKGFDDGDGSKARPVKTLAAAIAMAKEKNLPVNACAEPFTEAVKLVDGVTMYGYFDCADDWKRVSKRAKIVAPTSPAVLAENLTLPVNFEGFDVTAPDIAGKPAAGKAAATSYGMIIRGSKDLALAEVAIRAGKGQDGTDGVQPASGNQELSMTASGGPSTAGEKKVCESNPIYFCNFDYPLKFATRSGVAGGVSQCKVGAVGGPGGDGGGGRVADNSVYRTSGYVPNDILGRPLVATVQTAKGGEAGADGGPGPNGKNGTWSFSSDGFVPGNGTAGGNGAPGQGGGGGAGQSLWATQIIVVSGSPKTIELFPPGDGTYATGRGGGGGAGGCGGVAGTAGTGGGASVGLFVKASQNIRIANSRLEGGKGGRAGKGTIGTLGTAGKPGGAKASSVINGSLPGSAGFDGGDGGAAGLSGHGSPGPSIALAFQGARPTTTVVDLIAGAPGDGAPALSRGAQSLPAVTGEAKKEHSF